MIVGDTGTGDEGELGEGRVSLVTSVTFLLLLLIYLFLDFYLLLHLITCPVSCVSGHIRSPIVLLSPVTSLPEVLISEMCDPLK